MHTSLSSLQQVSLLQLYAKSLLSVAIEQNEAENVEKKLILMSEIIEKNPEILVFWKNPILSVDKQKALLEEIFSNEESNSLFLHFCFVLAEYKRLPLLQHLLFFYQEALRAVRNILLVEVTTSNNLTDEMEQRINESLALQLTHAFVIQKKVDASLIGGMTVKIGSYLWDGSIANKLHVFKKLAQETLNENTDL